MSDGSSWPRTWAAALLTLSLVGYPLIAPISVVAGIPNRWVSLPFRALIVMAAVVLIARRLLARGRIPFSGFWVAWWVFWALYAARMVIDGVFNRDMLRFPPVEYLAYGLGASCLPALAVALWIDDGVVRRAFRWIMVLGCVAIVMNLWLIGTQLRSLSIGLFVSGRPETTTLNPISIASLGALVLTLSAWAMAFGGPRGKGAGWWLLAPGLLGLGAMAVGASRGPTLGFVVALALLYYAVSGPGPAGAMRGRTWPVMAVILVVGVTTAWLARSVESLDLLARLGRLGESDSIRLVLWRDGWDAFVRSPLVGAGTEPLEQHPHNVVLEGFMMFGVLSGVLVVVILVQALWGVVRSLTLRSAAGWLSLLCVQAMVVAMVSGALYDSVALWVLMAAVVAGVGWGGASGPRGASAAA